MSEGGRQGGRTPPPQIFGPHVITRPVHVGYIKKLLSFLHSEQFDALTQHVLNL